MNSLDRINKVKEEIKVWGQYNFPNTTPEQCLLGMYEEIGELCHAILKESQGIRKEDFFATKKDALADITIYFLDYMNRDGEEYENEEDDFDFHYNRDLSRDINFILRSVSSLTNQIRIIIKERNEIIFNFDISVRCSHILLCIKDLCEIFNIDFIENLEKTWNEVKKRDWVKYFNGLTE